MNAHAIACMALMLTAVGSSKCCRMDRHLRVTDKLEAVVVVGFDKPPKCIQPPPPFTGRQGRVDTPVPLWIRAVHFDEIQKPLSGRRVQLNVLDAFGHEIKNSEVLIEPNQVNTLESGFNEQPVTITCKVPHGEYIVRASYADKGTTSVSYSAHLLCRKT